MAFPVFALHGFTGCGDDFDALQRCCPTDWQWHCPDLPGHGQNPLPPEEGKISLAAHLAFLESARTAACADQPCILLGYSMGGRLALHWYLQNPAAFAALILIGSSPGIEDDSLREKRAASDRQLAEKILQRGTARFLERWWANPLFAGLQRLPLGQRHALRHRRLQNTPAGLAASLRGVGTGELPSLWNRLPEITAPALFLAGQLDQKYLGVAKRMARHAPNARTATIPLAGHVAHLENPECVAREILHFLGQSLRT